MTSSTLSAEQRWLPGGDMFEFVAELCASIRANRAAHPERYGYRPKVWETDFDFSCDEQGITARQYGWENY